MKRGVSCSCYTANLEAIAKKEIVASKGSKYFMSGPLGMGEGRKGEECSHSQSNCPDILWLTWSFI